MYRALRSVCLLTLVSSIVVLSMPGCTQQGQGERCDAAKSGSTDCDDGLICVPSRQLAQKGSDRCCPAPNTETDSRCHRVGAISNTAGSSSGGASAGSSAGGTTSSGGAPMAGEASGGGSPELPAAGAPGLSEGGGSNGPSSSGGMSGAATDGGTPAVDPSGGKGGAP